MRYQLFDITAVVRLGTIYTAVTGLLLVGYLVVLTAVNVSFSQLGMAASPVVSAAVASLAVVVFLNQEAALPACLTGRRLPLTRERLRDDPDLADVRDACPAEMDALGADVVAPIHLTASSASSPSVPSGRASPTRARICDCCGAS